MRCQCDPPCHTNGNAQSGTVEATAEQEILRTPYIRSVLSMGMEIQHFQQFVLNLMAQNSK